MPKQTIRFDPVQTAQLAQLRDNAGVTQHEAAEYFGLKDRGSVHAWESGYSSPPAKHRPRFFGYLLDKLRLRQDPAAFLALWDKVMVNLWEWEPLTESELAAHLPQGTAGRRWRPPAIFLAPPTPPFALVGRQPLLRALRMRLTGRLETALFGLPGVGKTTLAIALANDRELLQQFPDGVLWARLGRQADVLSELGKWGIALGMAGPEIAALATIPRRAEEVHRRIGLQRLLLIMDDIWDVEAGLAFQLGGPNCARLFTTRFPTIAAHIAGEGATAVAELDVANGLQLFRHLAPAVVQREPKEAEFLVQQVGGLPLALVLLAGQLREALTVTGDKRGEIRPMLQRLKMAGARLQIATPQAPIRRHPSLPDEAPISLQAAIDLSYHALELPLQVALRAFAQFPPKPNSFSTEAALATVGYADPVGAAQRKLAAMTPDQALLRAGLLEVGGADRITLHQTIADYARQQPVLHEAVERMVRFFINRLEADPAGHGYVEQEQANIVASLQLAAEQNLNELFVHGVETYYPFVENSGLYTQADSLLTLAGERAHANNDAAAAIRLLFKRSVMAIQRGDIAGAEQLVEHAAAQARTLDQPEFAINQLMHLGLFAVRRGRFAEAKARFLDALALAQSSGNTYKVVGILSNLGTLAYDQGALAEAKPYLQQAYELALAGGYRERACGALVNLVALCIDEGSFDEAEQYLPGALELARATNHRYLLALALQNDGMLALRRHGYARAAASLEESLILGRDLAIPHVLTGTLRLLADLATERGELAAARTHLEEALPIAQKGEDTRELCAVQLSWGRLLLAQGHLDAASWYSSALQVAQRAGMRVEEGEAYFGLAQVARLQGNEELARHHGAASLAVFQSTNHVKAATVQQWLSAT